MPTGYTAGIVAGTTKDFREFAMQCMRSFGATIHMRDDPMDKAWEPRKPSEHYQRKVAEAEVELEAAKNMSLDEITEQRRLQLEKDKAFFTDRLKEIEAIGGRLKGYLAEAGKFVPPTKDHENFKAFLIQQLTDTLNWDGDPKYTLEYLEFTNAELRNLQPEKIKAEKIDSAERALKHYREEYERDLQICRDSNLWVERALSALL
jgi:hypothetical protein